MEEKMRVYDGVAVACFLILPPLFYTELGGLTERYGAAAWLALLLAAAVTLCLFIITSFLSRHNWGKSILATAEDDFGKPLAALFGVAFAAYFSYYSGIYAAESARVLKIYGFEQTPHYIIAGIVILTALIMNIFGWRAVMKSAGFFFLIILAGIALTVSLGLNRYDPDYLFPVPLNEIKPPDGLYQVSMFSGVLTLALFAPKFKDNKSFRRAGVISVMTAAGAAVLLCVCYIMMFSPRVGAALTSGFIEMGKSSYFDHFFYRFESPLLFFVIFSAAIQAAIGIWAAKENFECVIKIKSPRMTAAVCTVAAMCVIFLDLPDAPIKRYGVFFIAGAPLVLLAISGIKRMFK